MTDADRIAALELAVDELRKQVADVSRGPMHRSGVCPGCGGRALYLFRRIADSAYRGDTEIVLQRSLDGTPAGRLEAYACRNCFLVEYRATNLDGVRPDGVYVFEIHTPPEGGADAGAVYR